MSTSIVRIYTSGGFVIAADGRKYNTDTKCVVSDNTQKIFPIQQPDKQLVYALSGTVELTPELSADVAFDFAREIKTAVDGLAHQKLKSLWHYAEALSKVLANLPENARQALKGDEAPTVIYLDGYYSGRPKRALIQLFYNGQVPKVSTQPLHPGFPEGIGSSRIVQHLFENDPVAAKCLTDPDSIGLDDAIKLAESWMAAHCVKGALDLDPLCAAIGGRILICTLTPSGVTWIGSGPS